MSTAPARRLRAAALLFFLLCTTACGRPVPQMAADPTGIVGRVLDRGGSAAGGAYVYAYRSARGGLRGPADFAAEVGAGGDYLLDLAPGSYYLVARWRPGGSDSGPPRPGDAWAVFPGNPVAVRPRQQVRADFRLQGSGQPLRKDLASGGDTGFSGRLVDAAGRGVAGALVVAYRGGDLRRVPDAVSPPVGDDGLFVLRVPAPGRWCLAARVRTRGQPTTGELYGVLSADDGCRDAAEGEMKPVGEIVLTPRP